MVLQAIPILRIFDEQKAKGFHLDFLGMTLQWEHRFAEDYPVYLQVAKDGLVLHLTEHSGDCTPGSKVFVDVVDIEALFEEVCSRPYKYCRPALEQAPWGGRCFTVTDPFSNRILFSESTTDHELMR